MAGDQHDAGELGIDREAVDAGKVRAAMRGRSGERQDRWTVCRTDRELDERRPRLRRARTELTDVEAAFASDEVGVDGIDPLVGDRLEDPRDRRRTDGRTLAGRDLARIGQRDGIESFVSELPGEEGEAAAE